MGPRSICRHTVAGSNLPIAGTGQCKRYFQMYGPEGPRAWLYLSNSGTSLRSMCRTASPRGAWYSPSGLGGLDVAGGRALSATLLSRAAASSPKQPLQALLGIVPPACLYLSVQDPSQMPSLSGSSSLQGTSQPLWLELPLKIAAAEYPVMERASTRPGYGWSRRAGWQVVYQG